MAATYQDYTLTGDIGTSIFASYPLGTSDGEWLIAYHYSIVTSGGGADTFATPSGWTLLDQRNTTTNHSAVYYCQYDSGNEPSLEFAGTGDADERHILLVRVSGVNSINSEMAMRDSTSTTVYTCGLSELTTTDANCLVLWFAACWAGTSYPTVTYATQITPSSATAQVGAAYNNQASAGDSDVISWTVNNTATYGHVYGIALSELAPSSSYNETASGGIEGGSSSSITTMLSIIGAGGALAAGSASAFQSFIELGTGGALSGGSSQPMTTFAILPSGGGLLGGLADVSVDGLTIYSEIGSGGILAAGDSTVSNFVSMVTSGGAILGGQVEMPNVYDETPTGGVLAGGISTYLDFSMFNETASGGASIGGRIPTLKKYRCLVPADKITNDLTMTFIGQIALDGSSVMAISATDNEGNTIGSDIVSQAKNKLHFSVRMPLASGSNNYFYLSVTTK